MLIIRKEQMEVFQRHALDEFVIRASLVMRNNCPEETMPFLDEELRAIVVSGIQKAKQYGIKYEDDVLQYLRYIMRLGFEFDTEPQYSAIREILDQRMDGTMKIYLINNLIQSNVTVKR